MVDVTPPRVLMSWADPPDHAEHRDPEPKYRLVLSEGYKLVVERCDTDAMGGRGWTQLGAYGTDEVYSSDTEHVLAFGLSLASIAMRARPVHVKYGASLNGRRFDAVVVECDPRHAVDTGDTWFTDVLRPRMQPGAPIYLAVR